MCVVLTSVRVHHVQPEHVARPPHVHVILVNTKGNVVPDS